MITDMRDSISSWPIRIVLILIILSFVSFYGWRSDSSLHAGEVAVVNGKTISTRDFSFQYQNLIQNYQKQGKLTTDIPENLQTLLKQQLLTSMIYQKLKSSEAKHIGLIASDFKTKDIIQKQFSAEDGKFDFKFYESYLRNQMGTSPGKYEEEMRDNLRADLFEQLILETGLASDLQLKDSYKQTNEKVSLAFVKVNEQNSSNFRPKAKAPSDEDLKKYYTDHSDKFKTTEKRKLDIVYFEKDNFTKSTNFSKDAESTLQEFSTKYANLADAVKQDARLKRIETGMIGYDAHVSPLTSGELTEVLNATLNLEAGKSTVLASRDGKKAYLIKLEEISASKLPEMASIRSEVEKAYQANTNEAAFETWVHQTWDDVSKGTLTLDALAKKAGTSVKTTESFAFTQANVVPDIGSNEEIMHEAFKTKSGAYFSKPVKIAQDYYLIQVKNKVEPDWKKFEAEEDSISNVLHQQSAQSRFVSWMTDVEKNSKIRREATAMPAGPVEDQ